MLSTGWTIRVTSFTAVNGIGGLSEVMGTKDYVSLKVLCASSGDHWGNLPVVSRESERDRQTDGMLVAWARP